MNNISNQTGTSPLMALQHSLNSRFQSQLANRDQTQVQTAPLVATPPSSGHKVDVKA
jgi:hypothetical protein